MKDFIGNEIHVGNNVVALHHKSTSSYLYKAKVAQIGPKMLTLWDKYGNAKKKGPDKVVVITNIERIDKE